MHAHEIRSNQMLKQSESGGLAYQSFLKSSSVSNDHLWPYNVILLQKGAVSFKTI